MKRSISAAKFSSLVTSCVIVIIFGINLTRMLVQNYYCVIDATILALRLVDLIMVSFAVTELAAAFNATQADSESYSVIDIVEIVIHVVLMTVAAMAINDFHNVFKDTGIQLLFSKTTLSAYFLAMFSCTSAVFTATSVTPPRSRPRRRRRRAATKAEQSLCAHVRQVTNKRITIAKLVLLLRAGHFFFRDFL